jgi:hypothetical protein
MPPHGTDKQEPVRGPDGRWSPGKSGNPAGRTPWNNTVQDYLNGNHRTLDKVREFYSALRDAALGELQGGRWQGFAKMYANRVYGAEGEVSETRPVEELSDEEIEAALRDGN